MIINLSTSREGSSAAEVGGAEKAEKKASTETEMDTPTLPELRMIAFLADWH
jgi:hypothetical protein